jgi:hypothetical protein
MGHNWKMQTVVETSHYAPAKVAAEIKDQLQGLKS